MDLREAPAAPPYGSSSAFLHLAMTGAAFGSMHFPTASRRRSSSSPTTALTPGRSLAALGPTPWGAAPPVGSGRPRLMIASSLTLDSRRYCHNEHNLSRFHAAIWY